MHDHSRVTPPGSVYIGEPGHGYGYPYGYATPIDRHEGRTPGTVPLHEGRHRGVGPRGYQRRPERMYEELCDRLMEHPELDASDIEVRIDGTEVTLSGTVTERPAKRLAEDIADHIVGLTHVQNNLRVRA